MEPKEYYLAVIAIIDFVFEGNETVTAEKGVELAGAYWPRIFSEFSSLKLGVPISNGDFRFTRTVFLAPVREDCMHALEEIAKREEDRDLDNKSKNASIKQSQRAFVISVIAIIVSVLTFILQVFHVI